MKKVVRKTRKANPWIEWSKQAPRESDFDFDKGDRIYTMSKTYGWNQFEEIPYNGESTYQAWFKIPAYKGEPQPDATGWWRIEDRKPDCSGFIKAIRECSSITFICRYSKDTDSLQFVGSSVSEPISVISAWCPLDMTGPEEE